jgi:hypothetical protein
MKTMLLEILAMFFAAASVLIFASAIMLMIIGNVDDYATICWLVGSGLISAMLSLGSYVILEKRRYR